jgi:L-gulono-1,4-lactone dehydrogenase
MPAAVGQGTEASGRDPLPVDAGPRQMWRNWAGDQQCMPAMVARPTTLAELRAAVERARERDLPLRVAASGHSFTDIACTDGCMLRLEGLSRVLDEDREAGLVKVEAGMGLHRLCEELARRGLALENMGDIDVQTLAGAISTGTHGTGVRFGNMSTLVEAMELVLADGSVLECSRESDPDLLRAARVGLGSLGVIATVTLRCVPAFTLNRLDRPLPLADTLARLDELVESNDHFEFYTMPHSGIALLRETMRSDGPPKPRGRTKEYWQEVVLENMLMGLVARTGRRIPSRIPGLNRLVSRMLGTNRKVDRSHRVFASKRLLRFTEMEYSIPRAACAEALERVLETIERRGFAVGFPIEVRFVAPDDAYLSPAGGRETCYIAVHMYQGMEWYPYFRAVEAIMDSYDGRPHWGKRHFQSAATLAPRYPDWGRFQAARARLDPDGVFQNEYSERVLGPVGAAPTSRDGSRRGLFRARA